MKHLVKREGKIRINLCLQPDIHLQAKKLAQDCGLSLSGFVEQTLRRELGLRTIHQEPAAQ
jgi:predicted HicB family RNase H-like nuclease